MNKYLLIFVVLLFVAGCTPSGPVPEQCNVLETPREFGGGCCSDLNNNGICDDLEEQEAEPEPEPEPEPELEDIVEEPEEVEVIAEEPVINLSFTEEAANTFWTTAKSMNYVLDTDEYGDVWIWLEPGTEKYIAVENLWENQNGVLVSSQYHYIQTLQSIINGIEDRNLHLLNYLERTTETGQITGCFVEGSFLSMSNCIDDYPNKNPVIHYNPSFVVSKTPLDWLSEFDGMEPSKINKGRTYKITHGASRQVLVDEVFFTHEDGTSSKLYIHEKYRVPLQIDFLGVDSKVQDAIVFEGADFNTPLYDTSIKLNEEEFS